MTTEIPPVEHLLHPGRCGRSELSEARHRRLLHRRKPESGTAATIAVSGPHRHGGHAPVLTSFRAVTLPLSADAKPQIHQPTPSSWPSTPAPGVSTDVVLPGDAPVLRPLSAGATGNFEVRVSEMRLQHLVQRRNRRVLRMCSQREGGWSAAPVSIPGSLPPDLLDTIDLGGRPEPAQPKEPPIIRRIPGPSRGYTELVREYMTRLASAHDAIDLNPLDPSSWPCDRPLSLVWREEPQTGCPVYVTPTQPYKERSKGPVRLTPDNDCEGVVDARRQAAASSAGGATLSDEDADRRAQEFFGEAACYPANPFRATRTPFDLDHEDLRLSLETKERLSDTEEQQRRLRRAALPAGWRDDKDTGERPRRREEKDAGERPADAMQSPGLPEGTADWQVLSPRWRRAISQQVFTSLRASTPEPPVSPSRRGNPHLNKLANQGAPTLCTAAACRRRQRLRAAGARRRRQQNKDHLAPLSTDDLRTGHTEALVRRPPQIPAAHRRNRLVSRVPAMPAEPTALRVVEPRASTCSRPRASRARSLLSASQRSDRSQDSAAEWVDHGASQDPGSSGSEESNAER